MTDHPRIVELLETLVASGREVGVSSLRADRLSQPLVNALKAGGAQVLTVAADGATGLAEGTFASALREGGRLDFPFAMVVEMRDGRIARLSEYFDTRPLV